MICEINEELSQLIEKENSLTSTIEAQEECFKHGSRDPETRIAYYSNLEERKLVRKEIKLIKSQKIDILATKILTFIKSLFL